MHTLKSVLIALLAALTLAAQAGESTHEGGGMHSGIRVHGHWKIAVFEPNGTKVREITFQNALVNPGTLPALIRGEAVAGGMYIVATNQNAQSSGTGPCNPDCEIAPNGLTTGISHDSNNLVLSYQGNNFETLRLAGSVTATASSTIDLVQTWITLCNGSVKNSSQCSDGSDSASVFTQKTLNSGVAVTAGQIIQITVDLTFS